MLPINDDAASRLLDENDTCVRIIQIAHRGTDDFARFIGRGSNRVSTFHASLMNLPISRRDDLLLQRLKQPNELDVRLPAGHAALQSSPHLSKARRIRLRVVSYSRSDIA
jgi:hypothetical protein